MIDVLSSSTVDNGDDDCRRNSITLVIIFLFLRLALNTSIIIIIHSFCEDVFMIIRVNTCSIPMLITQPLNQYKFSMYNMVHNKPIFL